MKWLIVLMFVLSCQKQEVAAPSEATATASNQPAVVKEEDCADKANEAQKVEITEETIKLGGQPDAGCTLE